MNKRGPVDYLPTPRACGARSPRVLERYVRATQACEDLWTPRGVTVFVTLALPASDVRPPRTRATRPSVPAPPLTAVDPTAAAAAAVAAAAPPRSCVFVWHVGGGNLTTRRRVFTRVEAEQNQTAVAWLSM